jgi:hypothetical protein
MTNLMMLSIAQIIELSGMIINNFEKDVEGSGSGLLYGFIMERIWKPRKSVTILLSEPKFEPRTSPMQIRLPNHLATKYGVLKS